MLSKHMWTAAEVKGNGRSRDEEDFSFYHQYVSDRKMALSRLMRRCKALDKRARRMENIVTDREYDWDRRFESGS